MRLAVLDTNILVSALIRPEVPPGRVMAAVRSGQLVPVFSPAILAEYQRVLRRPRLDLDRAEADEVLDTLHAIGSLVRSDEPPPAGLDLPDASDWPFVACALATGCPVVTGNAKDFPPRLGVKVVTARQWVSALPTQAG